MAASHKLMNSGQLSNSTANDPSSVTGMVKTIILHNTNSSDETVEIYMNGTSDSDRMLKVSLASNETLEWAFQHMVVVLDAQGLKGKSTTASKVNYFIYGAEE